MPYDGVPVMVKPETTTLLLPEIEKPFAPLAPPLMVTPGFAVNVTPEAGLTELPVYVPATTCTVSPETAFAAALVSEQNGSVAVPEPEAVSEHAGFVLSTTHAVDADAATLVRTTPAMATPSTEPAMVTRRAAALIAVLRRVTEPMHR
jgi:hypothetical protein